MKPAASGISLLTDKDPEMPITRSGAKNIIKKLRTNFGLSHRAANEALNAHWMILASAEVTDWRQVEFFLDTFPMTETNCVRVIADSQLIATMTFPPGVLPQTNLQKAWAEYDAYITANPIFPIAA